MPLARAASGGMAPGGGPRDFVKRFPRPGSAAAETAECASIATTSAPRGHFRFSFRTPLQGDSPLSKWTRRMIAERDELAVRPNGRPRRRTISTLRATLCLAAPSAARRGLDFCGKVLYNILRRSPRETVAAHRKRPDLGLFCAPLEAEAANVQERVGIKRRCDGIGRRDGLKIYFVEC